MRRANVLGSLAVIVVVIAVLLVHPSCGPSLSRGDREPRSKLMCPASPESAAMQKRWRIRRDLTQQILRERIALLDAAELFRQANGEDGMLNLILTGPGQSVREKLCWQVISSVSDMESEWEREGRLFTGPRLSEEMQAELARRRAGGEFPPDPRP